MQSVSCTSIFAQDHTFEAIKNHQKRLGVGGKAVWDVATHAGEIATAVLVPSTQTRHFAHAAKQLLSRTWFSPTIMYSDTWPHKKEFWEALVPALEGRLGLFHYEKRILRTLRKSHIDFYKATTDLLTALHSHCPTDCEKLLSALRDGTHTGKKWSSEEIAEMRETKLFRDRHSKHLRKRSHGPTTIVQNLDDWLCRYKVTSSDPINSPAGGRLDPWRQVPLFAADTKEAVSNCKLKAQCIEDPLPLDQMCDLVEASPNSKHSLPEHLSRRGESKLEAFHDRLDNFANCGMRDSLADNLNLAGTARYNLTIHHKRALIATPEKPNNEKQLLDPIITVEERKKMPGAWEKVAPFFNHSELQHTNQLARSIGISTPFPRAETLPQDTGERFFSECISTFKPASLPVDQNDICICNMCRSNSNNKTIINNKSNEQINIAMVENKNTGDENINRQEARRPAERVQHDNTNPSLMPQQHAHQQPCFATTPAPTVGVNYYQQFQPMPAFLPTMLHQHVPQHCLAPAVCCSSYQKWLYKRKGRPPHDLHCYTKHDNAMLVQQQQMMGCGWPTPGGG